VPCLNFVFRFLFFFTPTPFQLQKGEFGFSVLVNLVGAVKNNTSPVIKNKLKKIFNKGSKKAIFNIEGESF